MLARNDKIAIICHVQGTGLDQSDIVPIVEVYHLQKEGHLTPLQIERAIHAKIQAMEGREW